MSRYRIEERETTSQRRQTLDADRRLRRHLCCMSFRRGEAHRKKDIDSRTGSFADGGARHAARYRLQTIRLPAWIVDADQPGCVVCAAAAAV